VSMYQLFTMTDIQLCELVSQAVHVTADHCGQNPSW
jgi:hypothetical protein